MVDLPNRLDPDSLLAPKILEPVSDLAPKILVDDVTSAVDLAPPKMVPLPPKGELVVVVFAVPPNIEPEAAGELPVPPKMLVLVLAFPPKRLPPVLGVLPPKTDPKCIRFYYL